jgi:hypothetical protein
MTDTLMLLFEMLVVILALLGVIWLAEVFKDSKL